MKPLLWIGFLAAVPALATDPPPPPAPDPSASSDPGPDADRLARFRALKLRAMQAQGLTPEALKMQAPPGATAIEAPPGGTAGQPPAFAELEARRASGYDKVFGAGAYSGVIAFSNRCRSSDGCDRLATMGFVDGADKFVGLTDDVEQHKLAEDSPGYEQRHGEIKKQVGRAVDEFRPREGANPSYVDEFLKASDPIVRKIYTPRELLALASQTAEETKTAPAYEGLGRTLASQGQPQRAKAAFDAALKLDPERPGALTGRAMASYALGDFPSAAADAARALELQPSDDAARKTLVLAQGRDGGAGFSSLASGRSKPVEARFQANAAGAAAPGERQAEAEGGSAVRAAPPDGAGGRPGPQAEAAVSAPAGRAEDLAGRARRALASNDPQLALETARRALALDPSNAAALALAPIALIRMKDFPAALAAAQAGLAKRPDEPRLLAAKATALYRMKDYNASLAAADRLVERQPKNATARFARAAALAGLGKRQESLSALREAAALDSRFTPLLNAALQVAGNEDMALLFAEPADDGLLPAPASELARGAARRALPAAGALALLGLVAALVRRRLAGAAPPRAAESPNPLGLLAGNYEVGERIGAGAVTLAYAGRDRALQRPVVIKRLREELRLDPRERARFLEQARRIAALRHPNIVKVYAVVEQGDEVFLALERVPGRSLAELLEAEGRLPFLRARALFRGVAAGLDHAHAQGVLHRDLKPGNVLLDQNGERARLTDFGTARLAEESLARTTRATTTRVGSPLYVAPEQEDNVARKESDVYSMACCLYEALAGAPPFRGSGAGLLMDKMARRFEPVTARVPGLPKGLDAAFQRAFEPEPHKRFTSAGNLQRALESLESPKAG